MIPLIPHLGRLHAGAISLAALLCLHPLWTGRGIVYSPNSDVAAQFLSLKVLARRALAEAGRLPLWNPAMNAGSPALANPQSAYLFPLDLLFSALPVDLAVNLVFLLNVVLAGLGMYALGRRCFERPTTALFAALAYMLAYRYLAAIHAGWLPRMSMYALTPLLLLACADLVRCPSAPRLARFAGVVGLGLLQGDMQTAYYAALGTIGYAVVATLGLPSRAQRLRSVACLASGALLGVMLAAPALLPALEYAGLSTRAFADYEFALSDPPRLRDLWTLIDPGDAGGARREFWENNFYFGLFLFPGLAASLARPRRSLPLLGCALLMVVLCFDSLLLRAFYRSFPGFGLFRQSPRILLFVQLLLVLQAGIGLEVLLARVRKFRTAATLAALACVAPVADAALRIPPLLDRRPLAEVAPRHAMHALLARAQGGGRVAATSRNLIPYGQAGFLGIDLVNGYSAMMLRHYAEYWNVLQFGAHRRRLATPMIWNDFVRLARPDLLRALDVEHIVARADTAPPLGRIGFERVARFDAVPVFAFYRGPMRVPVEVFRAAAAERLGPACFANAVLPVANEAASLAALERTRDPRRAHVFGLGRSAPQGTLASGRARLLYRGIDHYAYEAEADGESFLILSQIWYPGWRLTIAGAKVPLYRTNHALLGAFVPPGRHRLELSMRSPALVCGATLAFGAAALLALLVVLARRRHQGH